MIPIPKCGVLHCTTCTHTYHLSMYMLSKLFVHDLNAAFVGVSVIFSLVILGVLVLAPSAARSNESASQSKRK